MNENIVRTLGFGKEVDLVKEGKCPFCQVVIVEESFSDELSKNEFKISGLCQKCQDKVFGR